MLLLLSLVVGLTLGYNQRCEVDKDYNNVQTVDFDIPHVDEKVTLPRRGGGGGSDSGPYWLFYQWSAYYFGVIQPQPNAKTIIKAELYNDAERSKDKLVYGVEIDCDDMNWRSYVTSKKTNKRADFNTGNLNASVWWGGSCTNGDMWDLILKQNNERQFNWIFNGQPLQGETLIKSVKLGDPKMKTVSPGRRMLVQSYQNRTYTEPVPTKFKASTARALRITTTGRAVITRMVWGQCDTWPKDYVDKCLMAKAWVQRRSKAEVKKESLAMKLNLKLRVLESLVAIGASPDLGTGLAERGNQHFVTAPECFSEKYFNFYATFVHMDEESRNGVFSTKKGTPIKNVVSLYGRLYCCCTDMHTGVVPDVYENCSNPCDSSKLKCLSTYDPIVAAEVYKERAERKASGETARYEEQYQQTLLDLIALQKEEANYN